MVLISKCRKTTKMQQVIELKKMQTSVIFYIDLFYFILVSAVVFSSRFEGYGRSWVVEQALLFCFWTVYSHCFLFLALKMPVSTSWLISKILVNN